MKAVTFPLPPPRVPDDPLGGGGLCRRRPACPGRPALYAVRVSRCRGSASGLLSTPPRDDAVAFGSELAPPLPPEDFHLPVTARDGLDLPTSPRGAGNAVHLSRAKDDFKGLSVGRFGPSPTGSVDEVIELSVDGSRAGASPADEGVAGNELVDCPLAEFRHCPSAGRL